MNTLQGLSKWRPIFASLVLVLAACSVGAAQGQKAYSFNVFSGKPHRVDTYLSWQNNCVGLKTKARELRAPKHGSFSSKMETTTIMSANTGGVHNCKGQKIKGLSIYYKSKAGFRGQDSFVLTDGVTTYTYNMNVH